MEAIEVEIDRRLGAAVAPDSPNKISAADMSKWAVEYLNERDDELVRFRDLAGSPHWNLWTVDAESEEAMFAVLVFQPDRIEFFCGTGNSFAIRDWSENRASRVDGLMIEAQARFVVPDGVLSFDQTDAQRWLGRSW